jgi:hypothetical protein
MFHPALETHEQYIKRANVQFHESNPRKDEVMKKAQFLRSDKNAMSEHLRKSKVCTNILCKKTDDCGFAHSLSDFKAPVCIYEEFCESDTCTMFHPHRQTVDEYITLHHISFGNDDNTSVSSQSHSHARPYPDGAFTKMCNLMTADEPCPREWCTYAHSIYELHLPEEMICYDYHNEKDEKCVKFHPNQCKCCLHDEAGRRYDKVCHELLQFVINLGYDIQPFMTRHPSDNRAIYVKIYEQTQAFIDEMRELEESEMIENTKNDDEHISIKMSSLSIKSN